MTGLFYTILQTFIIIGISALGAETAIGLAPTDNEKDEYKRKKLEYFREHCVNLLRDAGKTNCYPSWLANLLIKMVEMGDAIPSFFVTIANYRRFFTHNGTEGNLIEE